jgi:hypothetical protein
MGKKTSRSTQTSKGERNNVCKDVILRQFVEII